MKKEMSALKNSVYHKELMAKSLYNTKTFKTPK